MLKHLIIALGLVAAFAGHGFAQTVVNPVGFFAAASADHNTVLADGMVVVTGYQLDTYSWNSTLGVLVFTTSVGKPTPDANNIITVLVPGFATLAKNASYAVILSAVGPGGAGASLPSLPFNRVGLPAAPGRPTVK